MLSKNQITAICILVVLVSFIPLFVHLGNFPIQLWDESRMAISAYEMYKSGHWLIPTFNGETELWNTKPPLLLWLQNISFHLFGINEFAIRFPSAMAGLMLFLVIALWLKSTGYHYITAILVLLLLITSNGFTGWHCLRTGDYEPLLILFILIQVISFYQYLHQSTNNQKWLNLALMATIFAVLAKGIHGLFMTPVLSAFWLIHQKWRSEDFGKFSLKIALTVFGCCAYYLVREILEPGFLHWVSVNEWGGRFVDGIENTQNDLYFYLRLFPKPTGFWIYLSIPLTIFGLFMGTKAQRRQVLYLISCTIFYFLIIQISKTKNIWYNVPMFPFLSMTTAMGLEQLLFFVGQKMNVNKPLLVGSLLTMALALVGKPYVQKVNETITQTEDLQEDEGFYDITNFLRTQLKSNIKHKWFFISDQYGAHNLFYINRLNDAGQLIKTMECIDSVEPNDTLLYASPEIHSQLTSKFQLTEMSYSSSYHFCSVIGRN